MTNRIIANARKVTFLGSAAGLMLCVTFAQAAIPTISAISGVTGGTENGVPSQTTLQGLRFTPSVDMDVTALGIYDQLDDGIGTEMRVGMFKQTGTNTGAELARVNVPAGTVAPLVNRFRYVELPTPLRLEAGNTYQLSSISFSSGSEGSLAASTLTINPFLTSPSWRAIQSNTFTDLVWFNPFFTSTFLGANFQFNVVPEPSSLTVLIWLLLGLAAIRDRSQIGGSLFSIQRESVAR